MLSNKDAVLHVGKYSTTNSPLTAAEQEAASRPIMFTEADFDHNNADAGGGGGTYWGENDDVTLKDPAAIVGSVTSPLKAAAQALAAQEEAEFQEEVDVDPVAAWIEQWAAATDPDDLFDEEAIAYLPPPTYHEEAGDIASHNMLLPWGAMPDRLLLHSHAHRSDHYIAAPEYVAEDDDDDEEKDHYPGDEAEHREHQLKRLADTEHHIASAGARKEKHDAAFAAQEAHVKAKEEHERLLRQEEAELKEQHEEQEDVPEDYYGFPAEVLEDWTPVQHNGKDLDGDGDGGKEVEEAEPYDWPVDDDDDFGQAFDGFEDTGFTDKPPVIHLTAEEYTQQVKDIGEMNAKCVGLVENLDPFELTSMGIWGNAQPGDYMVVPSEGGFDVLIDVGEDVPAMLAVKEAKDGRYVYNDRNFNKLQAVIDDMARRPVKVSGTSVTLQRVVNADGSTEQVEFRRSSTFSGNAASRGSRPLSQVVGGEQGGGGDSGISAEERQQLRVTEFFEGKGTLQSNRKRPTSVGGPVEIVMVPPLGMSFYATAKLGCFVKRLKPGGAAESTGRVVVGMRMLAVNGQALNGLTQQSIVRMVKETQGTCAVVFAPDPEGNAKMVAYQQQRAAHNTTTTNSSSYDQPGPSTVGGNLVTPAPAGGGGGGGGGGKGDDAVEAINRQLFAASVSDSTGYVEVNVDGYLYGDGAEGVDGTSANANVERTYSKDFAAVFPGISSPEPGEAAPAPPPRAARVDADGNNTSDGRGDGEAVKYSAPPPGSNEGMYSTTIVPDGIAAQINSMQRAETTRGKLLTPAAAADGGTGYVEVNVDGMLFGDGAMLSAMVVGDGDFTELSRQDAEARVLAHGQEGSYVLRPSTSCTSGRVLTAYFQGRTKHVQIDMVERGPAFHFRGMTEIHFPSIRELIDAYTNRATFVAADSLIPTPLVFAA